MPKLRQSFRGALRTFSFWMTNGTVGGDLLEGVDYSRIFRGPSALEAADAIFTNVLELEDVGIVLNAKWAERRPAHCMRH